MMTLKGKAIALATIAVLNLLIFLFMGVFVVISLIASIPFAIVVLKR